MTIYATLALEYFATRPRAQRTLAGLRTLCAHIAHTYALSPADQAACLEEALTKAQRRGWILEEGVSDADYA